jgi:hypothetical protein
MADADANTTANLYNYDAYLYAASRKLVRSHVPSCVSRNSTLQRPARGTAGAMPLPLRNLPRALTIDNPEKRHWNGVSGWCVRLFLSVFLFLFFSAFKTFPSSHLYVHVRDPDFSTFQAPSPGTHFRHPPLALPRSFPSFFYEVCSNHTIIDPNKVNGPLGEASATAILQAWVDKLEWTEDRCVEIKDYTPLDFQCLVGSLTLFSFLFLICPASSDLLGWGKGH